MGSPPRAGRGEGVSSREVSEVGSPPRAGRGEGVSSREVCCNLDRRGNFIYL